MQADPSKADPPKRKRRWLQFSLRTLLIGITLLAMACWVFEDQWRLIHERDEALKRQGNAMMQVEQARALARAEINQSVAVATRRSAWPNCPRRFCAIAASLSGSSCTRGG
jgi:hypothetical protein